MTLRLRKNSISGNAAIGILGTVVLKSIALITAPILSYLLLPQEYGNITQFNSWLSIFGTFMGIQVAGSLQNAYTEYGEEQFDRYSANMMWISIVSFVAVLIPFAICAPQLSKILLIETDMLHFMIPSCFANYVIGFMNTYLLTRLLAFRNFLLSMSYAIFNALFMLLFTKFYPIPYKGYIIGTSVVAFVYAIVIICFILIKGKFYFDKKYAIFALKFSLPLIMHSLGNIILARSDMLMLRYLRDETASGLYGYIHNYSALVNALWVAINSIFVPYYYRFLNDNDTGQIRKRVTNFSFLFTVITVGFMWVSPELLKWIINEQYHEGLAYLPLMIAAQYFVLIYSFSVNYEFYHKKTLWIAVGTIMATLCNIVLNYFMIRAWGILGATIATVIAYFLLAVFHELIARFVIKNYPVRKRFSALLFAVILIATTVSYLLADYWIVRWIIGALLGIVLVVRIIKTKELI